MADLDLKQESPGENEKEKKETTKETTPNKEKEEKPKVYKDFFLYFIEAHSTETSVEIKCLEKEYTKELEKVKNASVKMPDEKEEVYYTIYKLKVTPISGMKPLKIKFNLVVDKEKNFQSEIKVKEFFHDIFFYDFIYSSEEGSGKETIDVGKILSHLDQFRIYLSYLKDMKKEENSSEIEDLALSTRKHLTIIVKEKEKNKKVDNKYYDLSLYFIVFASCYKSPIFSDILSDFRLSRVDKKYYKKLSEEEIKKISDLFNELEETPGLVLNDNGKSKDEFKKKKINLFFIILFFRLFNEEDFQKSLKNILIKEDTEKKIYKGLAKYSQIFKGILFEKDQISKMVANSDNFIYIKSSLSNITSILVYFDIILENFDYIIDIRQKEIADKKITPDESILEIDNKKMISKNDDISTICKKYEKIIEIQKSKKIEQFVILSKNIFEKYIKFFENENLENLILLNKLAEKIRKILPKNIKNYKIDKKGKKGKKNMIEVEEDSNYKKYIDIENKLKKSINETGFYLSINKKLTNIEILNFIKEDEDYIKDNKSQIGSPLDIFEGLDLSSIDEEFMKEWKCFDWEYIFGKDININEKIFDMIVDFKSFGGLLKLLNTNTNNDKKKFSH